MAGILYGNEDLIDKARDFARDTGQQLQEKAFNFISKTEIRNINKKLQLHKRNVKYFVSTIKNRIKNINIKTVGALIFIQFKRSSPKTYRKIVDQWHKRSLIYIRAGFGWNKTSVRVYESTMLNQEDAPSYIRISVGIEPLSTIKKIADEFVKSASNF